MTDQYIPPTPTEIRAALEAHGVNAVQAARLLRINPRTFRRYTARTHPTPMPYRVWYTLKHKLGSLSNA